MRSDEHAVLPPPRREQRHALADGRVHGPGGGLVVRDPGIFGLQRLAFLELGFLHEVAYAGGRARRRDGQRDCRLGKNAAGGHHDRRAVRFFGRRLSFRIRRRARLVSVSGPLHHGLAERRAFHRDRHFCVDRSGAAAPSLLGMGRRNCARHHDGAHRAAIHRGISARRAELHARRRHGVRREQGVDDLHGRDSAAMKGIISGMMLDLARVAGETAPLLFTALSSRYWSKGWDEPTASLPVMIFNYAVSPYDDWHQQAWAAGFVLLALVLLVNIIARGVLSRATYK